MRVLRAVGEIGEGETGVRGTTGDLREREGREGRVAWAAVEMLRESLGLAERASMVAVSSGVS
jgi:hypothetical protein